MGNHFLLMRVHLSDEAFCNDMRNDFLRHSQRVSSLHMLKH